MDNSSGNSTRPFRAKQTLLDWFGRSRKETDSECAIDSSGKDLGCQEPHPDALALETPPAKKIRADDYIEITDSSPSSVDFDSCEDEPESCCIPESQNVTVAANKPNCAVSQSDIVPSYTKAPTLTVQSMATSMNFTSNSIVAGTESRKQIQARNQSEDMHCSSSYISSYPANQHKVSSYSIF